MKKIALIFIASFITLSGGCGGSASISNDIAAEYAGLAMAAHIGVASMTMHDHSLEVMSLQPTGRTIGIIFSCRTNSGNTVTLSYNASDSGFRMAFYPERTIMLNSLVFSATAEAWDPENFLSLSINSTKEFIKGGVIEPITNENNWLDAVKGHDENGDFCMIAGTATNHGKVFRFTGRYGYDENEPFKFRINGLTSFTLNGTMLATFRDQPLNDPIAVRLDCQDVKAQYADGRYYPEGVVSGRITTGAETISFTCVYNGTETAALYIGSESYSVGLRTGAVSKRNQ